VVEAGAPFAIKRFVVSTDLARPTRVRAIALKQGDRRVVRHAAFYENATGRWLGSWTPWQTIAILPGDVAQQLPARAQIAVEIGYRGTEEAVTDRSELGLYFDDGTGPSADAMQLRAADMAVAAGATGQRVRVDTKLAAPTTVLGLWPTPSDGARSIEISATSPDGVVTPLLWIKDYRSDWRSPYVPSRPVSLARGTRLSMTAYFDNTSGQPATARAQAWLAIAK
jgi:hypothetical protein